jgi:hypothetical protein
MKKFLLVLAVLPVLASATEPVAPKTEYQTLMCPQPVTKGCTVTPQGLFGATCTQEDFVANLPCMDLSYQQQIQYEENHKSSYPNN